ncbi:MAG: LysE family transporter [Peptococcaceae bacterium]|nr:LysE family transporter [Peptococcaceae bacterium]
MIYWTIFVGSLLMGFSGAIMPGPLLTVTINESLRRGAKAGPQLVVGHALLELTLVGLILGGLGTVITLPPVKGCIGVVGGVFLLWMAYGILRDAANNKTSLDLVGNAGRGNLNPFIAGITTSAANPYWSIWWASVGAGSLLLAGVYGFAGLVVFYFGHILADFTWYSVVSLAVAGGKRLFTARIYRLILAVCGVFLLGLAGYFIHSGLNFFYQAM